MENSFEITGNLIKLSDMFRRAVAFDRQDTAQNLVTLTRELGCMWTYYYPEYRPDEGPNPSVLERLQTTVKKMDKAAQEAGLKSLTLPFHRRDPSSALFRQHVLKPLDVKTRFGFQASDYKEDLSNIGWIRPEIKTFLDEGIRGLGAIETNLKYGWDEEIRAAGQRSLEF